MSTIYLYLVAVLRSCPSVVLSLGKYLKNDKGHGNSNYILKNQGYPNIEDCTQIHIDGRLKIISLRCKVILQ